MTVTWNPIHGKTLLDISGLNGNGHWSRLLANTWLKLHNQPLTDWPEESIGATSVIRGEYLSGV